MKIFLASKLSNETTWSKFTEYIGDTSQKKIAFIITAANAEGRNRWKKLTTTPRVLGLPSKEFSIIEIEEFNNKPVIEQLQSADIIITLGGYTGYLLYWLRFSRIDKLLAEIIRKGQAVYTGTSAGAMVTSRTQYAAEFLLSGPEPGASIFPGLGLIDFEIWPHFNEETESLEKISQLHQWKDLYVLKDGEHIIVEDAKVEVFGTKRRIGYNP